jgi:hypothetical protein
MSNAAFVWIKGDGLYPPAGTAGSYRMRKLMEGYDQHLQVQLVMKSSAP